MTKKTLVAALFVSFAVYVFTETLERLVIQPYLQRIIEEQNLYIAKSLLASKDLDATVASLRAELNIRATISDSEYGAVFGSITPIVKPLWAQYFYAINEFNLGNGKTLFVEFLDAEGLLFKSGLILRALVLLISFILFGVLVQSFANTELSKLQLTLKAISGRSNSVHKNPFLDVESDLKLIQEKITYFESRIPGAMREQQELLANVAHEFRGPLTRMQFSYEMLMDNCRDDQKHLIEVSHAGARELDNLVTEMLTYARIRSDNMRLETALFSVSDLMKELDSIHSFVDGKVSVQFVHPPEPIIVNADEKLILRALSNLIANAQKYAKTLVVVKVNQRDEMVVFDVIDDGNGISPQNSQRIFEPFVRLDSSRSRDSGGFGLGLSIVKSICLKHKGIVESLPVSHGAHFIMAIPIRGR